MKKNFFLMLFCFLLGCMVTWFVFYILFVYNEHYDKSIESTSEEQALVAVVDEVLLYNISLEEGLKSKDLIVFLDVSENEFRLIKESLSSEKTELERINFQLLPLSQCIFSENSYRVKGSNKKGILLAASISTIDDYYIVNINISKCSASRIILEYKIEPSKLGSWVIKNIYSGSMTI